MKLHFRLCTYENGKRKVWEIVRKNLTLNFTSISIKGNYHFKIVDVKYDIVTSYYIATVINIGGNDLTDEKLKSMGWKLLEEFESTKCELDLLRSDCIVILDQCISQIEMTNSCNIADLRIVQDGFKFFRKELIKLYTQTLEDKKVEYEKMVASWMDNENKFDESKSMYDIRTCHEMQRLYESKIALCDELLKLLGKL